MAQKYTKYSYAFGSSIAEMSFSKDTGNKYRYSFNGEEQMNELSGEGMVYDLGARFYDARLGRMFSIDPPWQSPYVYCNNGPVSIVDINGMGGDPKKYTIQKGDNLSTIAKNNNVTVENLLKWNKGNVSIKTRDLIMTGGIINVSSPNAKITLPLLIGKKGTVGNGEDSESGCISQLSPDFIRGSAQFPKTLKGQELIGEDCLESEEELKKDYFEVGDMATFGTFQWGIGIDLLTIANLFYSKKGGIHTGFLNIESEFENSDIGKSIKAKIKSEFMRQMIINKGDYNKVSISNIDPVYFGSICLALKAAVGGTQQLDIYLTSIQIHGNSYTANITYTLWDDYGVDEKDFTKLTTPIEILSGGREGVVAMWTLQHQRGYKPLILGFNFKTTLTGKF